MSNHASDLINWFSLQLPFEDRLEHTIYLSHKRMDDFTMPSHAKTLNVENENAIF